jgi:citrate lyase subunit beta/citryl-CoA lyase
MLFVPGHKSSWAEKAVNAGADAVILDLEDSVPPAEKEQARHTVRETVQRLKDAGIRADVWVRVNSVESGLFSADVEEVVAEGVTGILMPKVYTAREVQDIDAILGHVENRHGLGHRSIQLMLSLETAQSMNTVEEIAASTPRLVCLLGATGPNADVGRELGFEFTPQGLESLYLRSRILLASRANGMHHPISGVWQDISDLDGLRKFALDARGLGYRGLALIHPSHVDITNGVFTPPTEYVEYCRRLVEAFNKAQDAGHAAIDFEGQHVDIAHVKTAKGIIGLADAISV